MTTNALGPTSTAVEDGARKSDQLAGSIDFENTKSATANQDWGAKQVVHWRDHLPVHPAADVFPLMSEKALKELAGDIKRNRLKTKIVVWSSEAGAQKQLLDGRNRLDALALMGRLFFDRGRFYYQKEDKKPDEEQDDLFEDVEEEHHIGGDPEKLAYSLNLHRRHLTPEQKRELIARLIKAQPEKSDRQIAKQVKADHKTVGAVRRAKESTGEIPQFKKIIGADGKARKKPAKKKAKAKVETPATTATESSDLSKEQEKLLGLCGFALLCDVDEPVELPPLDRDQAIQAIKTLKTGEARLQAFRRKMGALSGVAPDTAAPASTEPQVEAMSLDQKIDVDSIVARSSKRPSKARREEIENIVRLAAWLVQTDPERAYALHNLLESDVDDLARESNTYILVGMLKREHARNNIKRIIREEPEPASTAIEGNDTDAQASADKCREEFAALDDGSDPLDIPAFLRRTP